LPYALFLPISFSEIKRVEVSKGPAAAIYGFSAFHGIVNIIPTDPDEMKRATTQVGRWTHPNESDWQRTILTQGSDSRIAEGILQDFC